MKNFILSISILLLLISCQETSNEKKILAKSTGRFNELLVVITKNEWEGPVGQALKNVLTSEVLGLPQTEPQFSIIRIEPNLFDNLLKRNRNILVVQKNDSISINIQKNVFAAPQAYITISGNSEDTFIKLIGEHANKIIKTYKNSDLKALQTNPAYPIINPNEIRFFKKQEFTLNIPNNFNKVDNNDNFLWYRNETYNPGVDIKGSMNLIAYTLPLNYPFEQVKDSISSIRNLIGEKNISGPKEGTYLITEVAYTPNVFEVNLAGKKAYKVYGKWEIKDGFMAGPFLSYFVNDPEKSRIIVIEGFVYAPSVEKRDYMFELEAILNTFKLKP